MRGGHANWLALVGLVVSLRNCPVVAQTVLDDFEDLSGWTASASPGASVEIARDQGRTGSAMRIDFDFHGGGGYVIVRKAVSLALPANYAFKFYLRGQAPPNTFQFKLVGHNDENVWWSRQPDFTPPSEWQPFTIKKARMEFAWGPSGGTRPLPRAAAIEFAITAGTGGKGSVWIDDLQFEEREPSDAADLKPRVSAASSAPGHEPEIVFNHDPHVSWRSGSPDPNQWLLIDFLKKEEYGGLIIDWDPEDYATAYQVQVSDDGESWTSAYSNPDGNGGRDYIYLHDGESRYIRLNLQQSSRGQGYGIREVTVKPYAFSASPNQFFEAVAADAPPGTYPKYFSGKQTYWTVIGLHGDDKEGLLNEEGALEVDKGAFSIEPFLYADGRLITWSSVHTTQELEHGYLPIPSVTWNNEWLTLRITVFAAGEPWASTLYAGYRIENRGNSEQDVSLFLTIRPFQVVPPWQSLNMVGGVSPIHDISFNAPAVRVNQEKVVLALTPPDHFGAATFQEGLLPQFLMHNKVPPRTSVSDPFGYASGALQYDLSLSPGLHDEVYLAIPLHNPDEAVARITAADGASRFNTQFENASKKWEALLGRVDFQLPRAAREVVRSLKSTLAYILINRDGPAIQPGSRTYERSWIRDGAITSTALLAMGFTEEVRDFIRWFGRYQFANGQIPCCVDRRGADSVPEHDSNGEFIYTVAEYYRYTHDIGFVYEQWPTVLRAVEYLASLRRQRLGEQFKRPDQQAFYGLLPESISHEGYASHPVHSYWDDFFALRGIKDAAALAVAMGDEEHAASFAALRDAFRSDLYASIGKAMANHKIDYIPGSVELGDFDPTSTAIAVTLGSEQALLPEPALQRTFDRYYEHVQERRRPQPAGDAYSPYELRNVEALVRLGERNRAIEILDALLADERPPGWNEWQEVVWRDPSAPLFIGDMPHTWVGSGFINSVRSMFAYEREADHSLVIAAGVPGDWVMNDSGVAVTRLPTHYGVLNYSLQSAGSNALRLKLSGDIGLPPGGIVIRPPLPQPLKAVIVNDKPIQTFVADAATIGEFPADILLEY
jgi:hypothetical protein